MTEVDLALTSTERDVPAKALRRARRMPIILLGVEPGANENFESIMAITDINYATQAIGLASLMNPAIDSVTGRFDANKARSLIEAYNAALGPDNEAYKISILNLYQTTVTQTKALVSAMVDKVLAAIKAAINVALGQGSVNEITAAVTDAFTDLKTQEGDAWIFWEKKEAKKTVYSYSILFAIQDATTGALMLALPVSLLIEVDTEYERVLWITVTDRESYSVKIEAMKIGQILFKKSPGSDFIAAIASSSSRSDCEAGDGFEIGVTDIEVKERANGPVVLQAANGVLTSVGHVDELMIAKPYEGTAPLPGTLCFIEYSDGTRRWTHPMTFIENLPNQALWFQRR